MSKKIKVLFLASEADPFIKIGGLGDVAGSLPGALRALGDVDIRLVIPLHPRMSLGDAHLSLSFSVTSTRGDFTVEAWETHVGDLPVYALGSDLITHADQIYHSDASLDGPKFGLFSLAALRLAEELKWKPDILHANDWHTALSIYALGLRRPTDRFFARTRSLLGVHNLPYLGVGANNALELFALPIAQVSALPWWAVDFPLPLGLLAADHIVAVSPTYSQEILTPQFGSGLDEFLLTRADTISGILNGIDTRAWDPESDPNLKANYTPTELLHRQINKRELQAEFNLDPAADAPLIAVVSRLDPQKGIDLIPPALRSIADLPWQAVILGTGFTEIEAAALALAAEFPGRISTTIRFDAALSHRIYAGADMLLIPSRYEPCGLTQMIAMRYGCIPIGNATGGLKDTIIDYSEFGEGTGFLFNGADSDLLAAAIAKALRVYPVEKEWQAMQTRGMTTDFSWEKSARTYRRLYEFLQGRAITPIL
jgi:starch synthase